MVASFSLNRLKTSCALRPNRYIAAWFWSVPALYCWITARALWMLSVSGTKLPFASRTFTPSAATPSSFWRICRSSICAAPVRSSLDLPMSFSATPYSLAVSVDTPSILDRPPTSLAHLVVSPIASRNRAPPARISETLPRMA